MSSRDRRLVLAGAVAVAVAVAGLAVYLSLDGPDAGDGSPAGTPAATASSTPDPAVDAARVRAENRRREKAAAREAERALASMPVPKGARHVRASDVPPLAKATSFLSGSNESVTRTGFWLVPADAQDLADWYTLNLPPGMVTEPHEVGGGRNSDGSWSEDVVYDGRRGGPASHSSALVQVTPVGNQAGVRITVFTGWRPARPLLSFAPDDVTAVRIAVIRNGHRRVTTVQAPADLARVVRTYDALPGTHGLTYSCPMSREETEYRLTFVSATRRLSASFPPSCWAYWRLRVDGEPIEPALEDSERLTALVVELTD